MFRIPTVILSTLLALAATHAQAVAPGESFELTSSHWLVATQAGPSRPSAGGPSASMPVPSGDSAELSSTAYLAPWTASQWPVLPGAAPTLAIAGGHSLETTSTEYLLGCRAGA